MGGKQNTRGRFFCADTENRPQNTRGRSFCADTENRPHVFLEYEFDIDAATGAILEFDADLKD